MKTFLLLIPVIIFSSCHGITGSGNIKTERRTINNFSSVKLKGSINVEVQQGKDFSVDVEADDNIIPYIVTGLDDNTLEVYYKPNNYYHDVHAKVYVTAPVFNKLIVSGSGNLESRNSLKNEGQVEVRISGSGDLYAMLDAPSVNAEVSGSGDMTLKGRTKDLKASLKGSGNLKSGDLLSENTTVNVSGSGDANVFASVMLSATLNGSGDINYSGNPPQKDIKKNGSGSIHPE